MAPDAGLTVATVWAPVENIRTAPAAGSVHWVPTLKTGIVGPRITIP